ncbi:hypothetical protein [Dactylosporangium sp. NPDC048998]|uniref:hypothetical protein n=1 Tax=Dactylosporangium sp. NPDC048998 TaxID=3363976 RepID=UPI003714FD53
MHDQVVDKPDVLIKLSHDQALVLSDWLDRVESTEAFQRVVDDRAVWSALHRIGGTLDKALPDLFASDYAERLRAAQERLIESLGDFGAEPSGDQG